MSATDDAEAMRLWPGGSGWAGLIRVPTRFVQNYTVRGSAGRVGELDAEQPPGTGPGTPQRGPWSPAPRESSESPTSSSSTTRALPGAPRALQRGRRRPGQGRLAGALGDQGRAAHVLLHGRPACPWNAASGYFLTVWHHGTRHVPWCQTVQPERAFVPDRTAPVSPTPPVSRAPEAGSGAPKGLS